jgi:ABC-type amino acid transport substrate-binding protein
VLGFKQFEIVRNVIQVSAQKFDGRRHAFKKVRHSGQALLVGGSLAKPLGDGIELVCHSGARAIPAVQKLGVDAVAKNIVASQELVFDLREVQLANTWWRRKKTFGTMSVD